MPACAANIIQTQHAFQSTDENVRKKGSPNKIFNMKSILSVNIKFKSPFENKFPTNYLKNKFQYYEQDFLKRFNMNQHIIYILMK